MESLIASWGIDLLDLVDADGVVGPAGVELGAALGPGEGEASKRLLGADLVGLLGDLSDLDDEFLLGEVEHLDAVVGGNDQPVDLLGEEDGVCLLYTSPSPRDRQKSRMPSSA